MKNSTGPISSASAMLQRDPIARMQMFLIREGILDEKGINRLEKQVDDDLQVAVDRALQGASAPARFGVLRYVYSPDLDPTSPAFETQPLAAKPEAAHPDTKKAAPQDDGRSDHRHDARRNAPQ